MVSLFLSALIGFVVSLFVLPLIIRYTNKKNLLVELNQRKIHKKVTPSMGGIAIFIGMVVATLVFRTNEDRLTLNIIAVLAIPFFIGFFDDLIHLRPSRKILGQLLAATLVFFVLDVKISSLYGLIGNYQFPEWLSYLVTITTIILLTNSFNLIDGIDGLAGVFSLVALSFFGLWFAHIGITHFALLSFALIGSVLAFLIKNWQPSRIFMGDTGSLVLGMSLSILAIAFLNENWTLPASDLWKFNSGIGSVLCILIIPVVDTVRVVTIRLGRGISPLTADKRHIHHALVRIGKSHRFAVLLLFVVHVFFVANSLLLKAFSDWYVIGSVLLFSTLLCLILDKAIARHTYSRKSPSPSIRLKTRQSVVKL